VDSDDLWQGSADLYASADYREEMGDKQPVIDNTLVGDNSQDDGEVG
jgi:hypothetical protein